MIKTNQVLDSLTIATQVAENCSPTAVYIHIPFCRRRCFYCDFPVSVVGDHLRGENSGTIAHYLEVLCQEIEITSSLGKPLNTIFFGGGTPSLLSVAQLNSILNTLQKQFGIVSGAEISMEMDPGTFDWQHIQGYVQAGVNRISLGVQAFQSELLQVCGRSHTIDDIFTAVDLIRKVGVSEFSLDLISGLPHQSLAQWQESLEKATDIQPQHISIYDLIIEKSTAFGRYYQAGEQPLPSDENAAQMYRIAQEMLNAGGYEHYEISNYAKPGYQCRHNRVYWENRPYYGFGMGAASYINQRRFTRPRKTKEYYKWVADGCIITAPQESTADVLLETLMLGLRLAEGLSLSELKNKFGDSILEKIDTCLQPYYQRGWVEIVDLPKSKMLRLTDPEGFLFSNTVLADLFNQMDNS